MTKPTYHHTRLEEADHTLNAFLDLIVEGTWDWNSESGHVTRSPGWYRMLGYPLDVFQPDVYTWENLIHPDDYDRVMAHFEAYITGQSNHYCVEYRCRTADDDFIWIEDRGRALTKNSEGIVTRMIGAHHDIHRQKLAELQLIEQTTLLMEGNLSLERKLAKKN